MEENQNIEFKSSWRDEYLKGICGFANAKGGKLLIGIDDKGDPTGLPDAKRLMEDIPNKIQNNLGVIAEVNLLEKNNEPYIEISVEPYDLPISFRGKYFQRSGSTTQEVRGNALQHLILKKMGRTWDDIEESSATIDDLDDGAIKSFIKQAQNTGRIKISDNESTITLLENLELYSNGQLKRAAILLFGKRPTRFYPNAFLKIGKFGEDSADLLFQDVIEGNVFEMADKAVDICHRKYFRNLIRYEGISRIEDPEFPLESLREAFLNCIAHMDYSGTAPIQVKIYEDHINIWNEGGLHPELTIDDLRQEHSSKPRNPKIAKTFFLAGFIEAWGRGTIKIINECKNKGFTEPIFQLQFGGFDIQIHKDIFTENVLKSRGLSDKLIKAILFTKENGSISNSEYQKMNNVSKTSAYRDLNSLVENGYLEKIGKTGVGTEYTLKVPKGS